MKKLENLKWVPRWVSHLGCVKGCLDYLGLDVSDAWLFGATGHAFVINVHEVVCPSGPTAWNTEMLLKLGKNVGYEIDEAFGMKSAADFGERQKLAWEHAKAAIDQGLPCYGWELDIPEYYVVYGYDEGAGYYFSGPGCDEGRGPKPWQELGESEIGVIILCTEPHWEPAPTTLDFLTDIAHVSSSVVSRYLVNEALSIRELELEEARADAIRRLGAASEYRDNETGMHIMRMTHYSAAIAKAMGMADEAREQLIITAPMHPN